MTDDPDDGEDASADPFDRLGPDADREGDPFERLGVADGNDSTQPGDAGDADGPARGDESAKDDPWVPPGEDRRDADPADGQRDGPPEQEWPGPDVGDDSHGVDAGPATDSAGGAAPTSGGQTEPTPSPDDPLTDVDTPEESPFDDEGPTVFERVDVGGADPDEVWETITTGDDEEELPPPEEGRYSEVDKHRFCEQCEFFSEPPDVTCTHETAEIIEFLDMETVRLLNCPVVAERAALEGEE